MPYHHHHRIDQRQPPISFIEFIPDEQKKALNQKEADKHHIIAETKAGQKRGVPIGFRPYIGIDLKYAYCQRKYRVDKKRYHECIMQTAFLQLLIVWIFLRMKNKLKDFTHDSHLLPDRIPTLHCQRRHPDRIRSARHPVHSQGCSC